ncbi:metallophosphoesterase [Microbacterium oxydans]|uniref:Calcineurin-like phosphoesterase superfamily domain protein n=1 Tax=Microbacterium oxydans TaxID=82380 RepID=A0A0F0LBB8_9MICO|nr:metallophosphoesterase [Microbacterium oxydans]KJL30497.1 Calcineurin-like phosphoesterase superfamily domain protein [Microbacterium oxydans]
MQTRDHAKDIDLPDQRVAVCGDWHGNQGWARMISRALPYIAPDVTTLLHLGDWWMPPRAVDEIFAKTSITRFYVTLGNHEQWDEITPLLEQHSGEAVKVSELTWILPRPARLTIGGRSVLSLGGASSVDRESRQEGLTWWPDEAITDTQVAEAIAGGPADLMLTHESPAGTPVRAVRETLRKNPHWFTKAALEASAASRARISEVWDAVRPELLTHGHMHVGAGGKTPDGRRVASLGREGHEWNLGILDMKNLRMATPSLAILRGYSEDSRRTREQRMHSTAEALHSGVLGGLKPSTRALRDAQDYIDGARTLDELIEDVRRRHTRNREEES